MPSPLRNLPATISYATRAPRPLATLPRPVSDHFAVRPLKVQTRFLVNIPGASLRLSLGPKRAG